MSNLLDNTDYRGVSVDKRVVAPGIKRCSIVEVRKQLAEEGGAKGPTAKTFVNLSLEEPGKTPDGDDLNAGFPVLLSINEWAGREAEARAKEKELAVAALGMERKTKDEWIDALKNQGGWDSLKGKHILVELTVSKTGFQDFRTFNRVNNGAA